MLDYWNMSEAYRNDPDTRNLIEVMIGAMAKLQFTPVEMKQAAVFAAVMFENRYPKSMIVPCPFM